MIDPNAWVNEHIAKLQSTEYKHYLELLDEMVESGGEVDLVYDRPSFKIQKLKVVMPTYGSIGVEMAALHALRQNALKRQETQKVLDIENRMNALEMYKVRVNLIGIKPEPVTQLQHRLDTMMQQGTRFTRQQWQAFHADLHKVSIEYTKWPMTYYIREMPQIRQISKSKPEHVKDAKNSSNTKKLFPFTSSQECKSSTRSAKYYMSKDDIIKTIKANAPLKSRMPAKFEKLKKDELCDALDQAVPR